MAAKSMMFGIKKLESCTSGEWLSSETRDMVMVLNCFVRESSNFIFFLSSCMNILVSLSPCMLSLPINNITILYKNIHQIKPLYSNMSNIFS